VATPKQISLACKLVTEQADALEILQSELAKMQSRRQSLTDEITAQQADIATQRTAMLNAQATLKALLDQP
jgi:septal ring factor EnvC (AmiA/AmiB activator)